MKRSTKIIYAFTILTCLSFGIVIGIGISENVFPVPSSNIATAGYEEINFVELYFPNLSVDNNNCPLGKEVFALSFVVNQTQCGYQNYGGKNLVAEVITGPYNVDRLLGMNYNYFVGPDEWTNHNITLFVRNGVCIDYYVEKVPTSIGWNDATLVVGE